MVMRGVLVSGPITALAAASPQRKVNISGRRTSGPRGGHKEGPQGRKGSISPLRCVNVGPEPARANHVWWMNLMTMTNCWLWVKSVHQLDTYFTLHFEY